MYYTVLTADAVLILSYVPGTVKVLQHCSKYPIILTFWKFDHVLDVLDKVGGTGLTHSLWTTLMYVRKRSYPIAQWVWVGEKKRWMEIDEAK